MLNPEKWSFNTEYVVADSTINHNDYFQWFLRSRTGFQVHIHTYYFDSFLELSKTCPLFSTFIQLFTPCRYFLFLHHNFSFTSYWRHFIFKFGDFLTILIKAGGNKGTLLRKQNKFQKHILLSRPSYLKHHTDRNTNEHEWTWMNTSEHEWTRVEHEWNTSEHEWNTNEHEWTRVEHEWNTNEHEWTRVNTSEHEWTRMNTSEHEWNTSEHEWNTNEHEWTRMENEWTRMENEGNSTMKIFGGVTLTVKRLEVGWCVGSY